LNPSRFKIFYTDGVSGVKNLNTCVLDFSVMSVVWSVWIHGCFMVVNLRVGPGFIFEPCRSFFNFQ